MSAILTITLSPALDYATSVPRIRPDEKLYCSPPRIDPGGGGVNVARAIGKLGGGATAFVVSGGPTGARLLELLKGEGIDVCAYNVEGETRYSFAVTDELTGEQQRFSLPGEPLTASEAGDLLDAIGEAVPDNGYVVLSGGVAPGLPDTFPQDIQAHIARKTEFFVIDTSKAPLERLVSSPTTPPFLLRLDRKEAAKVAHRKMETIDDSLIFATSLVSRGVARHVVTGRGAEGSIMVTPSSRYFCHAPRVPVKSKIGAGDALVGSLVYALSRGEPPDQALRWGVAAASATVGTEGTALCEGAIVEALFRECAIEEV
ncbi:MAG: 1-phosphofructokinase family hexose kinase [Paracoccaceae bacterium]|nr:1-phosphofructokinase family hexose kinase [Paracoccaceae bacterium]